MRIFDKNTMAATVHSNSSRDKKEWGFAIIAVAPWGRSCGRTVAPPKLALCRGVGPVLLTPSPPFGRVFPSFCPHPPASQTHSSSLALQLGACRLCNPSVRSVPERGWCSGEPVQSARRACARLVAAMWNHTPHSEPLCHAIEEGAALVLSCG